MSESPDESSAQREEESDRGHPGFLANEALDVGTATIDFDIGAQYEVTDHTQITHLILCVENLPTVVIISRNVLSRNHVNHTGTRQGFGRIQ